MTVLHPRNEHPELTLERQRESILHPRWASAHRD